MIVIKLFSGLGNQLFQYAIGRRIAHYHRMPLKLDVTWFDNRNFPKYMLNHFNIAEDIATAADIAAAKNAYYFQEVNFRFEPNFLQTPHHVYIDGYWQSERYFRDIESIIRRELIVKTPPNSANHLLGQKILDCESVSVHIRRGDYLTSPIHQVCTLDYYYNCIKIITSMVRNPHFFVFSDDWTWVEQNFKPDYPVTYVTLNSREDCHEDLRLMNLCRHHIIANSTFSWWGAWLAGYPRKIVCAPNKWLNSEKYVTEHIIPDTWYQITT